MRRLSVVVAAVVAVLLAAALVASGDPPAGASGPPDAGAKGAEALRLPYVYTRWKQFTKADGLPDDHVFAVRVSGNDVWVGTQGGLALIDRRRSKVVRAWTEADGLPFPAVSALDVDPKTGAVWIGLFGGGLARLSGGRFEHWHQLNSGLVNDVVYGVAVENQNVWCATTAGASRYDTKTKEWAIFTEKNAPMEEIWNYAVSYSRPANKVFLAVWGSGVLEYDLPTGRWTEYLDPDGEMEIDLYRDDGINHVIVTGVTHVDGAMWVSSYFGGSRYDGRRWRGFPDVEGGLPSLFNNNVRGRSAHEAWFCSDKGAGVIVDLEPETWVQYVREGATGRAVVKQRLHPDDPTLATVEVVETGVNVPHSFVVNADVDGDDVFVATSHGLGWGVGEGYYPRLKERAPLGVVRAPVPAGRPAAPVTAGAPVSPTGDWIPFDHPRLLDLLARIDVKDPFTKPDLEIRKDENYAGTPADVEPFSGTRPFNEFFLKQMEYTGPGRAEPEPEGLATVKVGFIGPIMGTVSVATGGRSHEEALGIPMLQGARLAVEEWNARGGYWRRKIPFELVVSNDNGLWGASGNEIIKQAYRDRVWAILGTIDGANSHIAIRVALKCEVPMMNTGDTDPTFIETNIPWVVRNIGDDRQQGYLLIDYAYRKMGYQRLGIIRSSNRYGRFGVREVRDGARRLQRPVPVEMAYRLGQEDFRLELERLKASGVDAIVHWGDAPEGGRILRQMREMGMEHPFLACDRCASREFTEAAGPHAEGVVCAYPWNPRNGSPRLARFRAAYRERFGEEAETYAAHAYDGMNMVLWAIQAAGLNRAKVRDVLAYLPEPWPGVTGDIQLSACLDDVGDVYLAKFSKGEWSYFSRADLDIPKGYIPPRDRLSRPGGPTER